MAERNGEAELICPAGLAMASLLEATLVGLASNDATQTLMLMLGVAAFAGGIILMFRHQKSFQEATLTSNDDRSQLFESRKYRRRMTASSMIAAIGVLLSALYWASDPRVYAILISLILVALLGVLGLACLDLFSVGLQQLAHPDDSARKSMIDEYLRKREQLRSTEDSGDDDAT